MPMRQASPSPARGGLLTYCFLWPGLPQLWVDGSWRGLVHAAGHALVLQAALLSSWVWTDVLTSLGWWALWALVIASWFAGVYTSLGWYANLPPDQPSAADDRDLFPQALNEYLQGNWFKAETVCRQMLAARREDADAGLLLVSVLRASGRMTEAALELEQLEQWDSAAKWDWEIQSERAWLKALSEEPEPSAEAETATSLLDAA